MASDRCPRPLVRAPVPASVARALAARTTGARPLTPGEQALRAREAKRAAMLNTFMSASPESRGVMPRATAPTYGIPQYGPAFNRTGLGGLYAFDALAPDTITALKDFRRQVAAAAERLEDSQPGWIMRGVQTLIGAGSTVSAGKEDLRQQKKLIAITDQRITEFTAAGDDLKAKAWLANARAGKWDDVSAGVAAGQQTSAAALYDQVVKKTIDDGAAAAKVGLKWLPWVAGGLVVTVGTFYAWRAYRIFRATKSSPGTAGYGRRRRPRRRRSR